jgi:hypothetical protein
VDESQPKWNRNADDQRIAQTIGEVVPLTGA